jgi:hypothetical protein
MRILHVFSANFFAGSVAYALALAEAHRREGHQVWLASDAASLPTAATVVQLPISQRKYKQRWHNIQALRQLVRTHEIDVVHAHSRAAPKSAAGKHRARAPAPAHLHVTV